MAFCPNLSDPDIAQEFSILTSQVGEEVAYWYWNRFKGDFSSIQDTLTQRGVRAQPTPEVPNISLKQLPSGMSSKMLKQRGVYRVDLDAQEIGEKHNSDIWELENQLGLVSIRKIGDKLYKFFNPVSTDQASKLKLWIEQNHTDVKVGYVTPWGDEAGTVGIRVLGRPKNVDKLISQYKANLEDKIAADRAQINLESREDLIADQGMAPVDSPNPEQEMADIEELSNKIGWETRKATDVLTMLEDDAVFDDRTNAVISVLKDATAKYTDLNVEMLRKEDVVAGHEESYAYWDGKRNKIVLVYESIHDPEYSDYNKFVMSILHEFVHAFTFRALENPSNDREREFKQKLKRLYNVASKNTENPDLYGYSAIEEFVAEIMTNYELVDDLKSMKFNWWQRFISAVAEFFGIKADIGELAYKEILEFIPTQEEFYYSGSPIATKKADKIFKEAAYKLRGTIDLDKRSEAVEILRGMQKDFEFVEGKGTVHKDTQWPMFPVTGIMAQYNLGVDKEELKQNETLKEAVERAGSIGTVVHGNIDQLLQGGKVKIANDLGFTSSPELRTDLEKILKKFKGQDVTLIPELYVADVRKGIGGKIDLVIIDKNNKIHLYDFKSKEKGFDGWTRRWKSKHDGSLKYSSRQAAHAQLTIYKRILEETTGLTVNSLSAILIEPSIQDKKVTGAKLVDVDTFVERSSEGHRIYDTLKNVGARESKAENYLTSIPGFEDPTRSYYVESKYKAIKHQAASFSHREIALNKLIKGLDEQIEYAEKTGNQSRINKLKEKKHEVETQKDTLDSLQVLLKFAIDDTWQINDRYIKLKKDPNKEVTIGQLLGWKRSVEAWQGFGDYATYLADQIEFIKDPSQKEFYENLMDQIDKVVKRTKIIQDRYVTEGMPKLAKYLAPFYNKIRAERRAEAIKEYRKRKPKGVTEEEFVSKILGGSKEDIDASTEALLIKQMQEASADINTLGRWLDNLLDSKDPVIAAMVKSFARTENIVHKESLNTRDRILVKLRQFEKNHSDRGGTVSYKQLYDFMLEKDENGKYTGHFVKRFRSTLWREYDEEGKLVDGYLKVIEDTRHLPQEQRDKERAKWKHERTTFDSTAFNSAKWQYIGELYKDQPYHITKEHIEYIRDQEMQSKKAYFDENEDADSLQDFANNGLIPQELVDDIESWVYKNAWEFRELRPQYKKKYENPQYEILMNKKGVDKELYELMIELTEEADKMLPYSSRLGGRLPGVRKRTTEMIKDNMGIVSTVRETWRNNWAVTPDDTERDNFSESGEEKAFLPIHYTGKIDPNLQSYDIPTIVFKYWQSATDFHHKKEILPEMELAKFLVQTRKTDPINNKLFGKAKANPNNLAKQLEDWFQMAVYGRPKKDLGKILYGRVDVNKLTDNLAKYTSLNLLGVNVIQGAANTILGEALQTAERVAGEYMSSKAYRRGSAFYLKNLPGVLGDVGARGAKNVVSHLMEEFNVLDEWEGENFSKRQKYRQALKSDTLFFTTHAGEHEMQGRFLLSMLSDKRAIDDNGKDIGSMLEMYNVNKKTGSLELDKRVNLKKSEWTEDDQFNFQYKVRGILSRLHGEYSDLGRVAIQRGAMGRLAFMFRKFIVPGFKRRWASEAYIERLDDFVEGNYISMGKFLGNLSKDLIHFKFDVASHWADLTDHQKANVRRTITEVSFLIMSIIMANLAIAKLKEDDDDDERFWSFMAYQALRLRAELLFFVKPDETMSILRSPMASMSVIENLIRLSGQITHPGELYERGPWKGQPKIYKTLTNMAPGYRQFYRVRDLQDQLAWFSSKIN